MVTDLFNSYSECSRFASFYLNDCYQSFRYIAFVHAANGLNDYSFFNQNKFTWKQQQNAMVTLRLKRSSLLQQILVDDFGSTIYNQRKIWILQHIALFMLLGRFSQWWRIVQKLICCKLKTLIPQKLLKLLKIIEMW